MQPVLILLFFLLPVSCGSFVELCRFEKKQGYKSVASYSGNTYHKKQCGITCREKTDECKGINWNKRARTDMEKCDIATSNELVQDPNFDYYEKFCGCMWKIFPYKEMGGDLGLAFFSSDMCAENCLDSVDCQGFDWNPDRRDKCYMQYSLNGTLKSHERSHHYQLKCGLVWTKTEDQAGISVDIKNGYMSMELCADACKMGIDCPYGITWFRDTQKCGFNKATLTREFEGESDTYSWW